jgi:hypothetical protein
VKYVPNGRITELSVSRYGAIGPARDGVRTVTWVSGSPETPGHAASLRALAGIGSRTVRTPWSCPATCSPDDDEAGMCIATDQKVGGSNPSERATTHAVAT